MKKTIFTCSWLFFWLTRGENSVFQKEKLGITRKLVIQNFSFFNTLFSPLLTQIISHSQEKMFSSYRKQKIMWTKYHCEILRLVLFLVFLLRASICNFSNRATMGSDRPAPAGWPQPKYIPWRYLWTINLRFGTKWGFVGDPKASRGQNGCHPGPRQTPS